MRRLWGQAEGAQRPAMSADFQYALNQEMLRTELLRIKVLIGTSLALAAVILTVYILTPETFERIWHGHPPAYLFALFIFFIVFELWIHTIVKGRLARHQDVLVLRRYIGAFIETSMPTLGLTAHIDSMGRVEALGFVVPLVYFMFIILSTLRLDFWLSTFTGFVASVELFGMAMFYHPAGSSDPPPDFAYHLARSVIIFVCGMLAGAVAAQLRRQFEASLAAATARDRITNLFGQHVSPQVAERLLTEGPDTAGDTRRVAVMFVDFRNFTAEAQARTPQDVVARLDGAFAVLVDVLDRHGGIVNKFLGDGFLALFGAPLQDPDPAHRAVAAAREMLVVMARDNESSVWPLRIGIGLHFGDVVAGNVGSPRRKEYTVIGDTVNFAARLESLNKQFNSQLLISSGIRDAVGGACNDAVLLGDVMIKGYQRPMAIWRLG